MSSTSTGEAGFARLASSTPMPCQAIQYSKFRNELANIHNKLGESTLKVT